MAEALAVIGVISSIVQLVDFGSKVLLRLHEYQTAFGETPKSFRAVKWELPILLDTLEQTKSAAKHDGLREETKLALLPVLLSCRGQLSEIRRSNPPLTKATISWENRGANRACRMLRLQRSSESNDGVGLISNL